MHTVERLETRATRLPVEELLEEFSEAVIRCARAVGHGEAGRALAEATLLRRELVRRLAANTPPF